MIFILIIIPLIISNVIHMVVVKNNYLSGLAIPLSVSLFGANKTYRGLMLVPLFNLIFMFILAKLTSDDSFRLLHGFLFGMAYVLSELPNSYLKRKMGIASGETAINNKILFQFLDKFDSAFGVTLLAFWIYDLALPVGFLLLFFSGGVHIIFSLLLVKLKFKRSF
jgi:hypothetical protein